MASTEGGNLPERKVQPQDIQDRAGISAGKLLLYEGTVRFTTAGQMLAINHRLGVVPRLVLPMTQDSGTKAAVYWEGRPRSTDFVYLKCSAAKTVCRIVIVG